LGGTGFPIFFLSGIGATAHIFQDFAPKYTDKYHVYGLTRRGFGASSQPVSGYDINTLAHDILNVADSLSLKQIILIGHSFAGQEVTKFASAYPDRVKKIIYLDAAYDWTQMLSLYQNAPTPTEPSKEDVSSLEHNRKYLKKVTGVLFPEDEMKASFIFDKDGKYIGNVSPDSISLNIIKQLEKPDYRLIKAKALAIYVRNTDVIGLFPSYLTFNTTNKNRADAHYQLVKAFTLKGQKAFTEGLTNGMIKQLVNANHYIFLSNSIETERLIRTFLDKK
jgi:non-heme chloroperoxidase